MCSLILKKRHLLGSELWQYVEGVRVVGGVSAVTPTEWRKGLPSGRVTFQLEYHKTFENHI